MTEQEKQQILNLRKNGLGYKAISKRLNIPLSSVSSFIKRGNHSKSTQISICKNCGNKLIQTKGHRAKIFCSDKCRRQWWKNNPESRNLKAYHECKCIQCGKEFISYSKTDRKYCSTVCYQIARFKREDSNG